VTAREKETKKETVDEGMMGGIDSVGEILNRMVTEQNINTEK